MGARRLNYCAIIFTLSFNECASGIVLKVIKLVPDPDFHSLTLNYVFPFCNVMFLMSASPSGQDVRHIQHWTCVRHPPPAPHPQLTVIPAKVVQRSKKSFLFKDLVVFIVLPSPSITFSSSQPEVANICLELGHKWSCYWLK